MSTGRIAKIHVHHGFEPAIGEAIAAQLRQGMPEREIVVSHREEELRARIAEIEVLLAFRPPRGMWSGARRLRLIQMMGAGVDALLPAPDLPAQVQITNARGLHGAQMSEFALAMMLALAKRIPRALEQQRAHLWKLYGLPLLGGKTLGILGLGAIGAAVADKARAFGMRVIGTQRTPREMANVDLVVSGPEGTERVLRESNYAVVLLPLTPETRGSIGARELDWLRPGAFFVNLARGGIVDEQALLERLRSGHLAGAASDVFAREPMPPDDPLWDAPNLIVTPHVAGLEPEYMVRLMELAVDNVSRLERGEPLRNLVDRERGY
ncbi:MAG TPA: D-2-hydroxyacid dehydrogenase [Myxococcota bacterium]|nr:D-2-hydroxyacid dehydrogenase [Myxococcota bacterium]